MNVQNLRENYPKLITHMEESGYCDLYVKRVQQEINHVLSKADSKGWTTYTDIYLEYAKRSNSRQYLRGKLTFLGILERFDVQGQYPDGRTRQKVKIRGYYQYLSPEFQRVIDTYRLYEERRGVKKIRTIYGESSNGASFLYELQCAGISSPEEITQKSIITVFLNQDGTLRRSCSYKKIIAAVFRANAQNDPELFNRLIACLPELRETRKNIQYLTDEEITEIKRTLANENSGLSLRDRAIGTLAFNYGLRCCDIAALKLDNVDLAGEKISIVQQKTAVPLELPLTIAAGNALYDYVTLAETRPFGRLSSGSFTHIAAAIMKAAGVRQNPGDRKGFHIFRHRLATALLGNGIAQPVISKIVGHTSPNSLGTYLSADFVHLKECALSIDRFPLRGEVFTGE